MTVKKMWIIALIVAYLLPWVVTNHPLEVGAYDLAEWLSLSPASLLSSFLLRFQLVLLTVAAVLVFRYTPYRVILVLLLVVSQFPPLEFISNLNDANQQQQALLAGFSLLLGIFFWRLSSPVKRQIALCLIAAVAIITSLLGFILAGNVFISLRVDIFPGVGIVLYVAAWGVFVVGIFQNAIMRMKTGLATPSSLFTL